MPIGFPIANARVYVLGPDGQHAAPGMPGELCIAGRPLARGYLNRPGLTAQRFVADPFFPGERHVPHGRPRAQAAPTARSSSIGRVDDQVKVRGVRIELGEVEAALRGLAGVGQAVAVVHGSGVDRRLVAYVVPDAELDQTELRQAMAAVVPDYLVPSVFVLLAEPAGHHERQSWTGPRCPIPARSIAAREYVPPVGVAEEQMALLWEEVLGVERVGRDDNFFALGGHSLLAMQLVSRVRSVLRRRTAVPHGVRQRDAGRPRRA